MKNMIIDRKQNAVFILNIPVLGDSLPAVTIMKNQVISIRNLLQLEVRLLTILEVRPYHA